MAPRRRHTLAEVLGPLEAEVMDVAWDLGEVTVRDVHEALNESRAVAYTTVMTTMGRLRTRASCGASRISEHIASRLF